MNFKTIVICLVAVASFGQNFDDYFDVPEITQTVEMPTTTTTSTAMMTTSTTMIAITTPIPTVTTKTAMMTTSTTMIVKTTPIPTETTQTTTLMPTETTKTTTTSTVSTFDANDTINIRFQPSVFRLLEELVNQAFERLEKKFDNISIILTHIPTTTTSTTTTTLSTTDVIDRFANEDVFSEFDEFDDILKKKDKKPKVETEKLLMVTIGCAGAGLIVLLLTFYHIYYCKRVNRKEIDAEKKEEEEDDENDKDKKERKIKLHIYEDVTEMKTLPPIPHADSESPPIPHADSESSEGEEDIYAYDENPPTVAKIKEGFIRKGKKSDSLK
jgi:hypothetical protein